MRCEGVLTGHTGYFNVGGLCRLDIPGQGVSCAIKTSLPGGSGVQQCDCAAHVWHTHNRALCAGRYYLLRAVLLMEVSLVPIFFS